MPENYIVINGQKSVLTEEQLEKLGINPEEENHWANLFKRERNKGYCYINSYGEVKTDGDDFHFYDNLQFDVGNYCEDKDIMTQRALHETLDRLLWRASVIAGELDNPWNGENRHFYIYYDLEDDKFEAYDSSDMHRPMIHFPTIQSAHDAIENIIKPFMKEHPNFVW